VLSAILAHVLLYDCPGVAEPRMLRWRIYRDSLAASSLTFTSTSQSHLRLLRCSSLHLSPFCRSDLSPSFFLFGLAPQSQPLLPIISLGPLSPSHSISAMYHIAFPPSSFPCPASTRPSLTPSLLNSLAINQAPRHVDSSPPHRFHCFLEYTQTGGSDINKATNTPCRSLCK
jgi:hypothetical protein